MCYISDDPIVKQQLLDDINDSSFVPKTFKSSRSDNSNFSTATNCNDHINLEIPVILNDVTPKPGNRKNETIFHDNVCIFVNIYVFNSICSRFYHAVFASSWLIYGLA